MSLHLAPLLSSFEFKNDFELKSYLDYLKIFGFALSKAFATSIIRVIMSETQEVTESQFDSQVSYSNPPAFSSNNPFKISFIDIMHRDGKMCG